MLLDDGNARWYGFGDNSLPFLCRLALGCQHWKACRHGCRKVWSSETSAHTLQECSMTAMRDEMVFESSTISLPVSTLLPSWENLEARLLKGLVSERTPRTCANHECSVTATRDDWVVGVVVGTQIVVNELLIGIRLIQTCFLISGT